MRFKVDENLPNEVARLLAEAGHDASTVLEEGIGGAPDEEIAWRCLDEERALITLDVGFADIRLYPPEKYLGLVVLRLERQDKGHVLHVISRMLGALDIEDLRGRLWIVDEKRIRIRE